jgi:hypothetical protein
MKGLVVPNLSSTLALSFHTTPPSPSDSNIQLIWSSLLKGDTITRQRLFENEHRSSVSDKIKALHKCNSIDAKKHVGMMNTRLKVLWDELNDGQNDWNDKAALLKTAEEKDLYWYKNYF